MRNRIKLGVASCMLVFAGLLSLEAMATIVLKDDRGQSVVLDAPAQRVVSLLPSLSESVCALGACDRLVGVDRYSNWPAALQKLPKLGGGLDPQIESVVAMRPDLVLMAGSTSGSDRLRALGLQVLILEPKTFADVQRTLQTLGQALGLPDQRAQQVWSDMNAQLNQVAQSLSIHQRGLRVYIEVSTAPHAASRASFMGEVLHRLGQHNIVGPDNGPFPPQHAGASRLGDAARGAVQAGVWPHFARIGCSGSPRPAHGRSRSFNGQMLSGETVTWTK